MRISDADDHYACDPADCPDAVQTGRRIVGDLADDQYDAAYAAYEDQGDRLHAGLDLPCDPCAGPCRIDDQAPPATRPHPSEGVQFCNWCPEPSSPDPRAHPGGQGCHLSASSTAPQPSTEA